MGALGWGLVAFVVLDVVAILALWLGSRRAPTIDPETERRVLAAELAELRGAGVARERRHGERREAGEDFAGAERRQADRRGSGGFTAVL